MTLTCSHGDGANVRVAPSAATLTLSSLDPLVVERAEELSGKPVAVVRDTTGARFAREHGARLLESNDIDAAIGLLAKGEVEAVVFDRPALQYYLAQHPKLDARLSPLSCEPLGYGFAVRRDDEGRRALRRTEARSSGAQPRLRRPGGAPVRQKSKLPGQKSKVPQRTIADHRERIEAARARIAGPRAKNRGSPSEESKVSQRCIELAELRSQHSYFRLNRSRIQYG